MIAFLTIVLFFLSFVIPDIAVLLVLFVIALNIGKVYHGYKERKTDPLEWVKVVLINGGMAVVGVILLIWACN